ncbi:MAG: DUF2865 domain-containing protein [Bauldia sp.]|nr:DUF2865 domain-containing protein [Bauldia sp.]
MVRALGKDVRRRRRRAIGGSLAAALVLFAADAAMADVCSDLRAQLAALGGAVSSRGGTGASSQDLKKLRTRALWGGCVAGGPAVAVRSPDCPDILARLNQLQGRAPVNRTFAFGDWRQTTKQRARIRRALSRNACAGVAGTPDAAALWGRAFRTLCVRACDGYYFPIATATPRSRLTFDEAACKSMYFGKAADLFVHAPGTDAGTARSLKGDGYAEMPYAFAFRSSLDPACVAEIRDGLAALAKVMPLPRIAVRKDPPAAPAAARLALPLPVPRARLYEDPETTANAAGAFIIEPDGAEVAGASDPAIRRLGPAYYYADRGPDLFAGMKAAAKSPPPLFGFISPAAAAELRH